MEEFARGETVICSCTVKDSDGKLKNPDSITITIDHALNGLEVDNKGMSRSSVGEYHYDYTTPMDVGKYKVKVWIKVIDMGRTTITEGEFRMR